MTRDEVEAIISEATVIIPVGAIEQHGEHLPLETDSLIIKEITEKVSEKFICNYPVLTVPVVCYGNSHHHFPYPTLSLSSETMIYVLKDLVSSLVKIGANKVLLLNSHGGNDEVIRIVARDMSQACRISVGAVSYWTLAWQRITAAFNVQDLGRVPGHAGGFETSLMLALNSEKVKLDKRLPIRVDVVPSEDNANRIYVSHANNSVGINGVSDDASYASKEIGEKCFSIIIEEVFQEVHKFLIGKL